MVLLDEIEKAHPDVFNTLLAVLDDGRLTDGQGRTVDFKNTVLIMTSNIRPEGGDLREALLEHFKPEFINRLDDIVEFEPLSREQLGAIPRWRQHGIRAEIDNGCAFRRLLGQHHHANVDSLGRTLQAR